MRDGFREVQHECLGRRVGRHVRDRLEGRGRRHIDDGAAPSRHHAFDEEARQRNQRRDIEIDFLDLALERQFVKNAVGAEAGIVDEAFDLDAALRNLLM